MPNKEDIDTTGLDLDADTLEQLLAIDTEVWSKEVDEIEEFVKSFGDRVPEELLNQVKRIKGALSAARAAA